MPLFPLLEVARNPWGALAHGCISPISASTFIWLSPCIFLYPRVKFSSPFSYKDTSLFSGAQFNPIQVDCQVRWGEHSMCRGECEAGWWWEDCRLPWEGWGELSRKKPLRWVLKTEWSLEAGARGGGSRGISKPQKGGKAQGATGAGCVCCGRRAPNSLAILEQRV